MCDRGQDRTDMVFSDDRGRRLLTLDTGLSGSDREGCPVRSQPSSLAAWP
jgi:hypothetical protein